MLIQIARYPAKESLAEALGRYAKRVSTGPMLALFVGSVCAHPAYSRLRLGRVSSTIRMLKVAEQLQYVTTLHFVIASVAVLSLRKAQSPDPDVIQFVPIYDTWGLLQAQKNAPSQ